MRWFPIVAVLGVALIASSLPILAEGWSAASRPVVRVVAGEDGASERAGALPIAVPSAPPSQWQAIPSNHPARVGSTLEPFDEGYPPSEHDGMGEVVGMAAQARSSLAAQGLLITPTAVATTGEAVPSPTLAPLSNSAVFLPPAMPAAEPSDSPSAVPTSSPTPEPTNTPTPEPTSEPTAQPTAEPVETPKPGKTPKPPKVTPTAEPAETPTATSTSEPTPESTETSSTATPIPTPMEPSREDEPETEEADSDEADDSLGPLMWFGSLFE